MCIVGETADDIINSFNKQLLPFIDNINDRLTLVQHYKCDGKGSQVHYGASMILSAWNELTLVLACTAICSLTPDVIRGHARYSDHTRVFVIPVILLRTCDTSRVVPPRFHDQRDSSSSSPRKNTETSGNTFRKNGNTADNSKVHHSLHPYFHASHFFSFFQCFAYFLIVGVKVFRDRQCDDDINRLRFQAGLL